MVAAVEIRWDKRRLERVQRMLRDMPKALPAVMSRSVNRTIQTTKTTTSRLLKKKIKIRISAIKKAIKLRKATRRHWVATLDISTKRIPLIEFRARRLKTGVSYMISPGRRQQLLSAFIQTMPKSGHRGVFMRAPAGFGHTAIMKWLSRKNAAQKRLVKRLPIIQHMGPSLGIAFESARDILREVQAGSEKTLEKNVDSQIKYILEKR